MDTYTDKIKNKIKKMEPGKVFIANDFLEIASYETIRRILNRYVEETKIQRAMSGFYYRAKFNTFFKEYEKMSMHELAIAIARKYNWDIAPSGNTALNILGLSTQVPTKLTYISSGRYKDYNIGKFTISFKKVKPGEISNMSFKTATIIQALKELGKEKVTPEVIIMIKDRITEKEKNNLINETKSTASWITNIIREIVGNKNV